MSDTNSSSAGTVSKDGAATVGLDHETRVELEHSVCEGLAFLERMFRQYAIKARDHLDWAEDQRDVGGGLGSYELEGAVSLRFDVDRDAAEIERHAAMAADAAKTIQEADKAQLEDELRRGVLVRLTNGDIVSANKVSIGEGATGRSGDKAGAAKRVPRRTAPGRARRR
jgi:hypothetical protein